MQNDKTTLKDLSIYTSDANGGIFSLIDRTTSQAGRDHLKRHIAQPPANADHLVKLQDAIKFWYTHPALWPGVISNGTIIMLEKFFESADQVSAPPTGITLMMGAMLQRLLNRQEYFLTRFSLSHLADFLKGCRQLADIAKSNDVPELLKNELANIDKELEHRLVEKMMAVTNDTKYSDLAQLNYLARREMKSMIYRLIAIYARLDAWQSMAKATKEHGWVFPEILPEAPIQFEMTQLYHPLVSTPVAYDIHFDNSRNFLVITGANMSGKTTFMRSLGVGALMAHLGMGVPAKALRISFLHGIITNMHVEDNILKGESYFFAEVQRIKQTAEKIRQDKPHLVLMDELFKGTNVHDAYECTKAVMDGLLNHNHHLMILSTHLYEVAHKFEGHKDILFAYFVTEMENDDYKFTYELKPGISNDRIGYRILQQEGVISLLQNRSAR